MPTPTPPYALDAVAFPLPALAAYAGKAPLGGDREMTMGALMAARLAVGLLPPLSLPYDLRERRADRAKHWITTFAMPNPARMALLRAFDATAQPAGAGILASVAESLLELARTLTGHLDSSSQHELAALAELLRNGRGRTLAVGAA